MLPVWQRLMKVAEDMESDPEFLLESDYFVFSDVSDSITNSCKHYRDCKVRTFTTPTSHACTYLHIHVCTLHTHVCQQRNSIMVEKLFLESNENVDVTINILKTYGTAIKVR